MIVPAAKKQLQQLTELGFDKLPICMAKTQFSFSDDATKLGAPSGFKSTVGELKVNSGAGFLVAKTGDIMTMPGLPKVPAADKTTWTRTEKSPACFKHFGHFPAGRSVPPGTRAVCTRQHSESLRFVCVGAREKENYASSVEFGELCRNGEKKPGQVC